MLYGNLAEEGSIVKTAGVDPSALVFSGPARVYESQGAAVLDLHTSEGGISGIGQIVYPPSDPNYEDVLHYLGGLRPGESKPATPFPNST